jgi:hypothetical protein
LAEASEQGDLPFVQKIVDLGERLGVYTLVATCKDVSQQAANYVEAYETLTKQALKVSPPPKADDQKFIADGISQMSLPAWPVSSDFKRLIKDIDLQMFMKQRFTPDRSVHYKTAVLGVRNMIAVIDLCSGHRKGGIDKDGHIVGTEGVSFDVERDNLTRLDREFRSFLEKAVRPALIPADRDRGRGRGRGRGREYGDEDRLACIDRLTRMKVQLEELLQDNFEINEYPFQVIREFRKNSRCRDFWNGLVDFNHPKDLFGARVARYSREKLGLTECKQKYSEWGSTAVDRLEEFAKCIEAARLDEPWDIMRPGEDMHTFALRMLDCYRLMITAARTVLLEFFDPTEGMKPTTEQLRNMSPIARSTLAMFYIWYDCDHNGHNRRNSVTFGAIDSMSCSLDLKSALVNDPEYAVALQKCMKGALPHLFSKPWGNDTIRDVMGGQVLSSSQQVFYFWLANMQHLYYQGTVDYNAINLLGSFIEMDRIFELIFGGASYLCDPEVKCTNWEQVLNDGEEAPGDTKKLVRSVTLFGHTPFSKTPYTETENYPNLRCVAALGQNGLEKVPASVDVVYLASPMIRALGNHNGSIDGLLVRAITDPFYRENIVSDAIIKHTSDRFKNGMNRHDLILAERSSSNSSPYRGSVSYVEPESFFRVVSFLKDLRLFCGDDVLKLKAAPGCCDDLTSVAHYRATCELGGPNSCLVSLIEECKKKKFDSINAGRPGMKELQLGSGEVDSIVVECKKFYTFCQQYEGEKSRLRSVLPVFVEQRALDYDNPFRFSNNLVCVDDRRLWNTAHVLALQCYAGIKETGYKLYVAIRSFLESCGVSVNSIPSSDDKESQAYILARQIYRTPLVRDMLDDINTLANEYFRIYQYMGQSEGVFDASNSLGLSEDEFYELYRAFKNGDNCGDKDDLLSLCSDFYTLILKRVVLRMKTTRLWGQHRCVYEAIEAQSLYELGISLFQVDDFYVSQERRGLKVKCQSPLEVNVGEVLAAANGGHPA